MEEHNQHIDKYFRQQLGGYTEPPPPGVWPALEARLQKDRRRRGFIWWFFLLAFLAATGFTAYHYLAPHRAVKGTNPAPVKTTLTGHTALPVMSPRTSVNTAMETKSKTAVKRTLSNNRTKTPRAVIVTTGNDKISTPAVPYENTVGTDNANEMINLPVAVEQMPPNNNRPDVSMAPPGEKNTVKSSDYDALQPLVYKGHASNPPIDEEQYQALLPLAGKKNILPRNGLPAESGIPATPLATNMQIPSAESEENGFNTTAPVPVRKDTSLSAPASPQLQLSGDVITKASSRKKITAGLKLGYESGTKPYRANGVVIAPFIQYRFTKSLGLLLQPSVKYAHITAAELFHGGYYKVTDSTKEVLPPIFNSGGPLPTGQDDYIAVSETYDSTFITHSIKDTRYWSATIPLMLSYKLNNSVEFYGGLDIHLSKIIQVETTKQSYTITRTDTLRLQHAAMSSRYDTPAISHVFGHSGSDISQYPAGAFSNPAVNPFKMGVTLGACYTFRQRFMFEILYRQTLTGLRNIPNDKVREIYSQPYLRLSFGYKFFK